MKNLTKTTTSPLFIVILFAFSSSGCAEILADIACSAGADYVHIGRMVGERPIDSPSSRAHCEMDPNCACLADGRCFSASARGDSELWWSSPRWWEAQPSGSYSTLQCKAGECSRLMDFKEPASKFWIPSRTQPLRE